MRPERDIGWTTPRTRFLPARTPTSSDVVCHQITAVSLGSVGTLSTASSLVAIVCCGLPSTGSGQTQRTGTSTTGYVSRTETERLFHEAPGHFFLAHEVPELVSFIQLALLSGWGGHLLPTAGHSRAFFSHDGYVDFAADDPANLASFAASLPKWGSTPAV